MAPPVASWGTHRVVGTWLDATGTRLGGTAVVALPVDVSNAPQDAIIVQGELPPITLSAVGPYALDVALPANDDPDNLPQGWKPVVTVALSSGRTIVYPIDATEGGETNLRTVINPQTLPQTADLLIVGVPGGLAMLSPDGLAVLDINGDPITGGGGVPKHAASHATGGTDELTPAQIGAPSVTNGTTRPAGALMVIFTGADPGANALDGDLWTGV